MVAWVSGSEMEGDEVRHSVSHSLVYLYSISGRQLGFYSSITTVGVRRNRDLTSCLFEQLVRCLMKGWKADSDL